MCLALPMKVIEFLPSEMAIVGSDGISMEVSLRLVENVHKGDYVLVHTGFALEVLDLDEAEKTLETLKELAATVKDSPEYPA